ncbi:transcriptional regulator [Marivirga harenae]|uniref:transcriptional regulator n=1 Tax=Marivirga harenae TaxID=2010992 RepID=UPI0026E10A1D|nr:transcriptional regulator [Marivirga harenae]WKV10998.1 transcriptional regulator [Marivirga harenae]|tara:strand:- start:69537 stop:70136 length:600 start_codon:yes stop_codon:yes gene_type:complete
MIAVITGDIINSSHSKNQEWLKQLKIGLNQFGGSPKDWEIFRGDSFQLRVSIEKVLYTAFYLKASIKQIKGKDVRMAIGIGREMHKSQKISESNGEAYQNSGKCFESLRKANLMIRSFDSEWDNTLNLMIALYLLTGNKWTPTEANIIKTVFENPSKNQQEIAEELNKKQGNISVALKRAGFDELNQLITYYEQQTQLL